MTDRTKSWAEMAADCATDAANATDHDDAMEWIGLSVANALLAIHDTLTAADRYAANEAKQREAGQEDAGGDPSASEGENGSVEGADADNAQNAIPHPEPLWCPECGHHIDDHHDGSCLTLCECIALPSQIAQALIADAVKAERLKLAGELRTLLSTWRDDGAPLAFELLATRWEQAGGRRG